MRPTAEFTAQDTINHPATGVRAYNRGDDVPASAVENWQLRVGTAESGGQVLPANVNVIPRPSGNAKRAEWEAYWWGQGLTHDEIDGMTRDEMAQREPVYEVTGPLNEGSPFPGPSTTVNGTETPEPVNVTTDPVAAQATEQTNTGSAAEPAPEPAKSAPKADWVQYAVDRGMPRDAAEDSTVKQLQDTDYDNLFGRR